jgi:hypothetical protein
MQDGFKMQLLGGEQRKPFPQVETHLVPEGTQGACPGTIGLFDACFQYVVQQVKILDHRFCLACKCGESEGITLINF